MSIENRLKDIRLAKGYRYQKDFALFLNIPDCYYCRLENNQVQVSLEAALDISSKLYMHVEDIFYKTEPKQKRVTYPNTKEVAACGE